jgi:hypothetical protein
VAIQADGKIVVAGNGAGRLALARYTVGVMGQPDGSLDTTFGQGGIVLTASTGGQIAEAQSVAIYPSTDPTNGGKIVAAGDGAGGQMLARYQATATLTASMIRTHHHHHAVAAPGTPSPMRSHAGSIALTDRHLPVMTTLPARWRPTTRVEVAEWERDRHRSRSYIISRAFVVAVH